MDCDKYACTYICILQEIFYNITKVYKYLSFLKPKYYCFYVL